MSAMSPAKATKFFADEELIERAERAYFKRFELPMADAPSRECSVVKGGGVILQNSHRELARYRIGKRGLIFEQ